MEYRKLGRSGISVSTLSFGSWVTFGPQLDVSNAAECMSIAYDAGVNFFDNAEAYAGGRSEKIMGEVIEKLGWQRHTFIISTKFYWGIHEGVNTKNTLNRKYLLEGIDSSLTRFGLDYVDIVYCHRPDPTTPIEETVWAMSDMIDRGKALYWGTSEWSAGEIREAHAIADKRNLRAPITEQPEYNLLKRDRVESEYAPLYEELGMGTTTWSPLAFGLLTGKYLDGIPEGSRGSLEGFSWMQGFLSDPAANAKVAALKVIADDLGCTLAQLSIAWCSINPNVSTVITGASRPEQVVENLKALDVAVLLSGEVMSRINDAVK